MHLLASLASLVLLQVYVLLDETAAHDVNDDVGLAHVDKHVVFKHLRKPSKYSVRRIDPDRDQS